MNIICSLGEKIENTQTFDALYKAGMSAMRLNFSHAQYGKSEHFVKYARANYPQLTILQDLQGPKLRISRLFRSMAKIEPGQEVIFCSEKVFCDNRLENQDRNTLFIPLKLDGDFRRMHTAKRISLKHGALHFSIKDIHEDFIQTQATGDGLIRSGKAINAPGMTRMALPMTTKDKEDTLWGLKQGVNIICASFVSSNRDIIQLKQFIDQNRENAPVPSIWAKIETMEGFRNMDSILPHVEGIVVGRSDLQEELEVEIFTKTQQHIIEQTLQAQKQCVVAHNILPSMQRSAEPSNVDIAALTDIAKMGVKNFMLTYEVSHGDYPVETVTFLKEFLHKTHS